MLDLVIRGGQVVTPHGVGAWDVGVEGERIVAVAAPGTLPAEAGRVDRRHRQARDPRGHRSPRAHPLADPRPGRRVHHERAAGAGEPGRPLRRHHHARRLRRVGAGHDHRPGHRGEGSGVAPGLHRSRPARDAAGRRARPRSSPRSRRPSRPAFPSFKIFTTDVRPIGKGRMIRLGHLWAIMETAAKHGGILAIHAEDDDLVMYMYERLEREGRTDIQHMPLVHSAMSEDISFRRVLRLARYVEGAAVYFVHVSAGAGVEAIAEARGARAAPSTARRCTTTRPSPPRSTSGPTACSITPIRRSSTTRTASACGRGSATGRSAPWPPTSCARRARSRSGAATWPTPPAATSGVETRVPIIYTEGVSKRGMSLERFVDVTATNAAKLLGLYPQKGRPRPGERRRHRRLRSDGAPARSAPRTSTAPTTARGRAGRFTAGPRR